MKDNQTLVILVDKSSPRLSYVLDEVLTRRLNLNYEIRLSDGEIDDSEKLINYSKKIRKETINLFNEGLLFEDGPRADLPKPVKMADGVSIFPASSPEDFDLPYDIFSAIFFCLTRYEEYVIQKRDQHGRFEAASSIFYGYHHLPYLDRWVLVFKELLAEKFQFEFEKEQTLWYNTLDMDIAFAYKGRDTFRMLGATARDLIHLKIGRLRERVKVLSGEEQDPFDTYSTFLEAENASVKWLFVPTGSRSEFDNNLSISTSAMKSHVRTLASKVNIGLHPSYASLNKVDKISVEKRHLEEVIGAKIRFSRQHFLRFTLPDTFNMLDSEGMELDFSMGFHDEIGFRAGTAFPFAFYDLESDTPRALQLYPLVAMDSAMKNYLRLSPKQAQEKMNGLAADMRSTGGAFTSVWHNHSLSDRGEWKGWLEVYQYISRMFGSRR